MAFLYPLQGFIQEFWVRGEKGVERELLSAHAHNYFAIDPLPSCQIGGSLHINLGKLYS